MMKRTIVFLIIWIVTCFSFSTTLELKASIDREPGFTIQINTESNEDIDLEDIHVEVMVLKSDFNEYQIFTTISEEYIGYHPNYESYTHLENEDEMSYYAFVQGTSVSKYQNTIYYSNEYGADRYITYIRLILFTSDGTILATSEHFLHNEPNQDSDYSIRYEIDYSNLTFIQIRLDGSENIFDALFFLLIVVVAAVILVFMGAGIWLLKTGLSSVFEIKYKKPLGTMIFDAIYIILSIFAIYIPYYKRMFSSWVHAVLWVTLIYFVWNIINFFFLAQKETRKKYWIIFAASQTISFLVVWLIMSQSF